MATDEPFPKRTLMSTQSSAARFRLPARHAAIVMPFVLSVIMTFVVSAISTLRSLGLSSEFLSTWPVAWGLSWLVAFNVINTTNDFVRSVLYALERITEPLYRPIRRIMPDLGALDLSPLVVLLVIYILMNIVIPQLQMSVM